LRTPFVVALLSTSIAWTPLSSATAQQSTAQRHGFVGIGGGASHVSTDRSGVQADTRPSVGARAGYGGSRVMIVLDWQRHGLGDEEPLVSDWPAQAVTPTRSPQVLEADFLLLGAQIYLTRELYLRPALGVGRHAFVSYAGLDDQPGLDTAYVANEAGPAAGVSMGYHLKVHQRFSLGIEASLLLSSPIEGEGKRTAFGIQVTPLLDF
jgi:hypothetical protein